MLRRHRLDVEDAALRPELGHLHASLLLEAREAWGMGLCVGGALKDPVELDGQVTLRDEARDLARVARVQRRLTERERDNFGRN